MIRGAGNHKHDLFLSRGPTPATETHPLTQLGSSCPLPQRIYDLQESSGRAWAEAGVRQRRVRSVAAPQRCLLTATHVRPRSAGTAASNALWGPRGRSHRAASTNTHAHPCLGAASALGLMSWSQDRIRGDAEEEGTKCSGQSSADWNRVGIVGPSFTVCAGWFPGEYL